MVVAVLVDTADKAREKTRSTSEKGLPLSREGKNSKPEVRRT